MEERTIEIMKLVHGSFNFMVMLAFFYHARLGLTIRQARLGGGQFPLQAVKRHRKAGPVLTGLGVMGFIAGMTVVYLDEGKVFDHPLHFLAGAVIAALLLFTYGISRGIKGPDSPLRKPHFVVGITILGLYVVQSILGLSILL